MTLAMRRLEEIVREAGRIAVAQRAMMERELKPDGSIVTNGDRVVETFLRETLGREWRGTEMWGEEYGFAPPGDTGLWILDPIDGTSNYAHHSPLWGVSIALYHEGRIALGAIDLPDLRETYSAAHGEGAWCNGVRITPPAMGPVEPWELVSYGESILTRFGPGAMRGKMRLSGSFVIDGTFTLRQRYRALVGHSESLYDVAAVLCMARELGFEIRYMDGRPLDERELIRPGRIPEPWCIVPPGGFWMTPVDPALV